MQTDQLTSEQKKEFIDSFNEIEKNYKDYEKLYKSYLNLLNNKDFKKVIIEGYIKDESVRLVKNSNMFTKKSTPDTIAWSKEQDKLIEDNIKAISYFNDFLQGIELRYERITNDFMSYKETVNKLKQESSLIEDGVSYTKIETE